MLRVAALLCVLILSLGTGPLRAAENSKRLGDYEVHYNAFNSSTLSAEVAKQYQITRGANQGVLNVAVRSGEGMAAKGVKASLSGKVRNLLGQSVTLNFKEVREGDAIYYLAVFRFEDQDHLNFDLTVQPEGSTTSYPLQFMQQLYVQ